MSADGVYNCNSGDADRILRLKTPGLELHFIGTTVQHIYSRRSTKECPTSSNDVEARPRKLKLHNWALDRCLGLVGHHLHKWTASRPWEKIGDGVSICQGRRCGWRFPKKTWHIFRSHKWRFGWKRCVFSFSNGWFLLGFQPFGVLLGVSDVPGLDLFI